MHTTRIVRLFCIYLIFYRSINRLKKSTNLHCSIVIATCICQTNPIYSSWIRTIDAIGFYFNRNVASIFVSKQVFQLSWIFLQMPPHPSNTFHLSPVYPSWHRRITLPKVKNPQPRCNIRHNKFNPVLRFEVLHLKFLVFNSWSIYPPKLDLKR